MQRKNKIMSLCLAALLMLVSCGNKGRSEVSASDALQPISSEEKLTKPETALTVYLGEETLEALFILNYDWNGEKYTNPSSLNRLMMEQYALDYKAAPAAADGGHIELSFTDTAPEKISATRYGNTLKANSGLPYDISVVELKDEGSCRFGFDVNYGNFKMLYYTIACEWADGNSVEYCFAVRK